MSIRKELDRAGVKIAHEERTAIAIYEGYIRGLEEELSKKTKQCKKGSATSMGSLADELVKSKLMRKNEYSYIQLSQLCASGGYTVLFIDEADTKRDTLLVAYGTLSELVRAVVNNFH